MGLNVSPALAELNTANQFFADSVLKAELALDATRLSCNKVADSQDLGVRQLGTDLIFPLSPYQALPPVTAAVPSLLHLVGDVHGVGSKEQVGRANAGRVVARMKDLKSFWDRAVHQLPLHSVGQPVDVVIRVPDLKGAVAVSVSVPSPRPAPRGKPGVLSHTFSGGCSILTHCIAIIAHPGLEMQPGGVQ